MKTIVCLSAMSVVPMMISMIAGMNELNMMVSAVIMATCSMVSVAMALGTKEKGPSDAATSDEPVRKFYDIRVAWDGITVKEVS